MFWPLNTSSHFWLTSVVLTVQGDSFDLNWKGHTVFGLLTGATGLVRALWGSESTWSPVRRSSETLVTFPCGVSVGELVPTETMLKCHLITASSWESLAHSCLLNSHQHFSWGFHIWPLLGSSYPISFILSVFQPLPKLGWLLRVHIDDSLFLPFPLWNFPWLFRARDSCCWWGCHVVLGLLSSGAGWGTAFWFPSQCPSQQDSSMGVLVLSSRWLEHHLIQ